MAQQSGRLLSLDVMRGITIAGMILVNNPGSWKYVYTPLEHARWNGLTPTDLVFPFFMFIMGVSMFFSLRKYNFKLSKESVTKVLRRTVLIFLVGLGLNLFGHVCYNGFTDFQNLRILGVMQRLALAYGFGSLIGLAINHKYILQVAAGILIFYWALLGFTHSMEMSEDSIIAIVDKALFGTSHMYHDDMADGTRIAFDPEGLLSCIGSIAHVLLGFYVGKVIQDCKKNNELIIRNIFIFGTIILFAGFLLSYGCPINKKIWSSTFVLVTCGFASLFLALLIWIIDINGKKKWTLFFESFGINPLYLYVQGDILAVLLGMSGISAFMYMDLFRPIFGDFGGYRIFGSSPETHCKIEDGRAYIDPIAGTTRRTGDVVKDRELTEALLADPKENAEHVMLVDLARNDLSRNCHDVRVLFYKEPQYYSHVIHLVSRVSGMLNEGADKIKTFIDTFPAGTLSGAPKVRAMQLISEIEPHNRGAYGGCIGFIGLNGELNQAITIRTFVSRNNELWFQAGGGIVARSQDEYELQEVNNKLGALKKAIDLAVKLKN